MKKVLLFIFFLSCFKPTLKNEKENLLLVSIAPYKFFVQKIAGEGFVVKSIAPAGVNPHAFEPRPKQVEGFMHAKIWFQIGEPFEERLSLCLKEKNPSLLTQDLREDIPLIRFSSHLCPWEKELNDRHVWLSPKLAKKQAFFIKKALCQKFPSQKKIFARNFSSLCDDLDLLDAEIEKRVKNASNKTLLVSHPALGYFCKEYGLSQLSLEFEGKETRLKHLEEISQKLSLQKPSLALAFPQHNNKGAHFLAKKLGIDIRYIDPYSPDYTQMLTTLATWIEETP